MNQSNETLSFERPIVELESKVRELKRVSEQGEEGLDLKDEIVKLQNKTRQLTEKIYAKLNDYEVSQIARHPNRPHSLDYLNHIFQDFSQLHGDRHFADDKAIVGGLAFLNDHKVVVIGQEKGSKTNDKIYRNFGMPRPEGYRKALRLMKMAERFRLPVVCLVDTPGAYPGIDAEQRNQSEAIATNLLEMSRLQTPIVSLVIGEGGSGGALGLAVADKVLMLQYSIYSVISPEGCSSILYKSAHYVEEAAKNLALTAYRLKALGLIDGVIEEPLGGAHRNRGEIYQSVKTTLTETLDNIKETPLDQLVQSRQDKFLSFGQFDES